MREISNTLFIATVCADARVPWKLDAAARRRKAALVSADRAIPESAPFPFGRKVLLEFGPAALCLAWPRSGLPGAVVLGALPEVPVLVLVGEDDLRTPVENAVALTQGLLHATTIVVPRQGHSVLTQQACAKTALRRFLDDAPVETPCNDRTVEPRVPVQAVPVPLDELRAAPDVPGVAGRTLTAVERTLFDAALTFASDTKVAGLRGGTIECLGGCAFPVTLQLSGTSLIRGVVVSGTVRGFNPTGGTLEAASVTVTGRQAAAGALDFHADGSVTGRLGDQDIATTSGLGRALARLAELRAMPVIGARRRQERW